MMMWTGVDMPSFLPQPSVPPAPPGPGVTTLCVLRHADASLALVITFDASVHRMAGELDLFTAPYVQEVLTEAIKNIPERPIVLDLTGVTFIDTSGLDALLGAQTLLAARGRCLTLWAVSHPVAGLLHLTGNEHTFARRTSTGGLHGSAATSGSDAVSG
jgi:anti-sigma B factor antagonist